MTSDTLMSYEPERFLEHLESTAGMLGAGFSAPVTRRMLSTFDCSFRNDKIQIKTGSVPGTGLYYRAGIPLPKGVAVTTARNALLLGDERSPAVKFLEEADMMFNHVGYDFSVETGLSKVWVDTIGIPQPSAPVVLGMKTLPASVRAHARLFERRPFRDIFFIGVDLEKRSMNLYVLWPRGYHSLAWMQAFAHEVGSSAPSYETMRQILDMDASPPATFLIGMTFTWDHGYLWRWCIYAHNLLPRRLPPISPRLAQMVAEAPSLDPEPMINIGWSQGRGGEYMKLEKNYVCRERPRAQMDASRRVAPTPAAPTPPVVAKAPSRGRRGR